MDANATPDDSPGRRPPAVPLVLLIISILVAVGAVSVLLVILFKTTTGPGQTLRQYYRAVSTGDCDRAYALLSSALREGTDQDMFCQAVQEVKTAGVPGDIVIQAVTGFGEPPARFARVTIEERGISASTTPVTWRMAREGGDWFIDRFAATGRCGDATSCVPL